MQRQQRHEWKVETEEGIRLYRAVFHSKKWQLSTAMKGRRSAPPEWLAIDEPSDEQWQSLRDTLFAKYQRKRCPWKLIEDLDKKLGNESAETLRSSKKRP